MLKLLMALLSLSKLYRGLILIINCIKSGNFVKWQNSGENNSVTHKQLWETSYFSAIQNEEEHTVNVTDFPQLL